MKKLIIIFVLLLTGCYNYQDINDIGITNVMRINKMDDYYEISIEVVNTNKNAKKNTIYKTSGKDIKDVFDNIEDACPLNISYDHIKVVLINNNMVNDFNILVNYLLKEKRLNDDIYFLVDNNKAININDKDLIKLLKKNHTITLYDILNNYLNNAKLVIPNISEEINVQ